jgi:hypothetical protein
VRAGQCPVDLTGRLCGAQAFTHDFMSTVLGYVSHLESAIGPPPVLGPVPNNRPIKTHFNLTQRNLRLMLFGGPGE